MHNTMSKIKTLARCEDGGVLIMLSISTMVLLLAGAVAVDMSRYETARAKFAACVDNAALAALHAADQADNASLAAPTASSYFAANCSMLSTNLHLTITNYTFPQTLTLNGSATTNTTLMSLFGYTAPLHLTASSTVATSNNSSMEVVMVLDNTGSMAMYPNMASTPNPIPVAENCKSVYGSFTYPSNKNSRMCALQQASEEFIYILAGGSSATTLPTNSWIGIVPFSQSVNVGGYTSSPNFSTNFAVPLSQIITTPAVNSLDYGPIPPNNALPSGDPAGIKGPPHASCPTGSSGGAPGSGDCTYSNGGGHAFPTAFDFSNAGNSNWYGCVGARTGAAMADYTGSNTMPDENDNLPNPSNPETMFPLYWSQPTITTTGGYQGFSGVVPGTYNLDAAGLKQVFPKTQYPQLYLSPSYVNDLANYWKFPASGTSTSYIVPEEAAIVPAVSGSYPQGPNAFCTAPLTTMTNDIQTLLNGLQQMRPTGQTVLASGMQWGSFMLSGFWGGNHFGNNNSPGLGSGTQIWAGPVVNGHNMQIDKLPLPYNQTGNLKVMLFMTDGYDYFFPGSYTAYGMLPDNKLGSYAESGAETELDQRFLQNCINMQNEKVDVFVVALGNTDGVTTGHIGTPPYDVNGALLRACASSPSFYFLASDAASLQLDFQLIADLLSHIRIAQ